jgi:chromosome segregation ATPase
MFSKKILREDLEALEELKAQQHICAKLIGDSMRNLVEKTHSSIEELNDDKSAIFALNDKLAELNAEIEILEEQMFLNYSNTFAITATRPSTPGKNFPHIKNM